MADAHCRAPGSLLLAAHWERVRCRSVDAAYCRRGSYAQAQRLDMYHLGEKPIHDVYLLDPATRHEYQRSIVEAGQRGSTMKRHGHRCVAVKYNYRRSAAAAHASGLRLVASQLGRDRRFVAADHDCRHYRHPFVAEGGGRRNCVAVTQRERRSNFAASARDCRRHFAAAEGSFEHELVPTRNQH